MFEGDFHEFKEYTHKPAEFDVTNDDHFSHPSEKMSHEINVINLFYKGPE